MGSLGPAVINWYSRPRVPHVSVVGILALKGHLLMAPTDPVSRAISPAKTLSYNRRPGETHPGNSGPNSHVQPSAPLYAVDLSRSSCCNAVRRLPGLAWIAGAPAIDVALAVQYSRAARPSAHLPGTPRAHLERPTSGHAEPVPQG